MDIVDPVLRLLPWLVFGQGLFLSAAVLSRWKHRGNRYLGFFLLLLSLHGLVALAWQNPQRLLVPEISVFFSALPFLYGPLIYRYVWHSFYREWLNGRPFILHAIPGILNILIYGSVFLIVGRSAYAGIVREVYAGRGPLYVVLIEYLKIAHGIVYTAAIIRLMVKHRTALTRWTAKDQRGRWLKWLIATFAVNWLLVLVSAVILWSGYVPRTWGLFYTALQLVSFLTFLYIVTFFALRYPAVLGPREVREAIRKKLNLSEDFIAETLRRLEKAEGNDFYTDSEVTLDSLARKLGLHANALSYIVNEVRGAGFREYLNGLRLNYFLNHAAGFNTYLEGAFASGFASKTTFLRAFRDRFDTTPAEYLARKGTNSHTRGTGTHTGAS